MKKAVAFLFIGLSVFILYLYFFVVFEELSEVLKNVNPTEPYL